MCDGKPLGERNPKWLNDDYVKFIRFAQWRIDRTGEGVLGFITNHGFLDNPTFRGMRQALMQSFHEIHILDLHGNDRKKEIDPATGLKDENVFDIQQGVAIILAVKKKNHTGPSKVFHKDLFGKRAEKDSTARNAAIIGGKYGWLRENTTDSTKWTTVVPLTPNYYFQDVSGAVYDEYSALSQITNILPATVLGYQSHRDAFALSFLDNEARDKYSKLSDPSCDDVMLAKIYDLKENRDWTIADARKLAERQPAENVIGRVAYRAFDFRHAIFSKASMDYPRTEFLSHVWNRKNLVLNTNRQTKVKDWAHAMVTDVPAGAVFLEVKDGCNAFPLYLYPVGGIPQSADPETYRVPNFSEDFLKKLAVALGTKRFLIEGYSSELSGMILKEELLTLPFDPVTGQYHGLPHKVSPEDIFHYIYAILHSPSYRERYKDFLKIDFPRIPLPKGRAVFEALIPLGRKLTALHLLDATAAPELGENRHGFPISGDNTVDEKFGAKKFPSYEQGKVSINQLQHFKDVSPEVWSHIIGGYQPAEKWLKDRRGRTLTTDDLRHYQRMLIAIAETRSTMPAIDSVIESHGGFPGAFV